MYGIDFTLTGEMPLLMHADDVMQADTLKNWRQASENKNFSTPGDDRTPAWTWQTYVYNDGERIVMPSANVCVAIRQAAVQLVLKKNKTFKELSQSGMLPTTEFLAFTAGDGKQVSAEQLRSMRDDPFDVQAEKVKKLGFLLDVRRVKIGQAKHVRVRPRFPAWSVRGSMTITMPELTPEIVKKMFDLAGRVGLGDWRPGCKTPGAFGMFTSEVTIRK